MFYASKINPISVQACLIVFLEIIFFVLFVLFDHFCGHSLQKCANCCGMLARSGFQHSNSEFLDTVLVDLFQPS